MASKARDLSNFISTAAIDASEIATGAITTDKIADTTITHAKLHTTMDLSGKTVTLPTINALDVTNNINVGGTVDGVDIQTLNTTAGDALPKAGGTMTGALTVNAAAVFNETGADVDFRVEASGQDKAIIVNGATGYVGINTTGMAQAPLHILKTAGADTIVPLLILDSNIDSPANGKGGSIVFQELSAYANTAEISAARVGAGGSSEVKFKLRSTDVMTLNSSGNVGIGTASPTSGLEISGKGLAVGSGSTASGTVGSVAIGHAVTASGERSFVFGREMTVSGDYSFGIALNDQNGTNLSATNTMAIMGGNVGIGTITPSYPLDVTGDTIQNGVRTFTARFNVANNASISFDVAVPNEGGGGNSFMIHCGHNHYYITSYGTHRIAMVSTRGTNLSDVINVGHQTSGNGGSWNFSKPSSTILRITKNAGTYGGGGAGFVHVVFSSFV